MPALLAMLLTNSYTSSYSFHFDEYPDQIATPAVSSTDAMEKAMSIEPQARF
jgi:hypothetical protein